MPHTDLKFFTNEPERDLYTRFATIMKSNTQFFDVLVGYFRTSGFFRMYEALEDVEKIRIVVGLNVDRYTVKIIDKMKQEIAYSKIASKDGKEIISDEVEEICANCNRVAIMFLGDIVQASGEDVMSSPDAAEKITAAINSLGKDKKEGE